VQLLVIDSMLAAVLVAALVLAFGGRAAAASAERRRVVGWLLIALPLPAAAGLELFASPPRALADAAFVAGLSMFALGALLVLRRAEDDGPGAGADPESPPWWPEFERQFRAYARRRPRQRVLR
jgi:hypothetical protein